MANIGWNEPCPCGSGRKYKKCCIGNASVASFTTADRRTAMQRLLLAIHPEDLEIARRQFWGKHLSLHDEWARDQFWEMAECAFEAWVFYDELADGETHAEHVLACKTDLSLGERAYIEMGRRSSMRLYEMIAVQPGIGITFRDVMNGDEIRVSERSGSRFAHTWDLVAARIFATGASGQPEIDGGMLPMRVSYSSRHSA